uniref:Uncharacterized protein n=1 Tax=viral metagenome TaxID=1070528 RepID=A0A6C0BUF8_9ZZZZ
MSLQKNIKDLIYFYVKTNYDNYLKENKIQYIENSKIENVISELFESRKDHIKIFIKESLKKVLKDEYPGDQTIQNILLNIFQDEEYCKNRLTVEIKLHQQKQLGQKQDYSKLLNN